MAPNKLTEYEKKRLENIRRNDEMMAALKLHSVASQLSASTKRQRVGASKSYKVSPEKKKPKQDESPIVIRRSLRTRGMPPDSVGLGQDSVDSPSVKTVESVSLSPSVMGPICMSDAYCGTGSYRALLDTLLSLESKSEVDASVKSEVDGDESLNKMETRNGGFSDYVKGEDKCGIEIVNKKENYGDVLNDSVKREVKCEVEIKKEEIESCVDLWSMNLKPENVARVLPGRIMTVKICPCNDTRIIVAGNKSGNVAFWNVDSKADDGNGIYLYHQHTGPVSGILFQQSCLSKIFTSCYDGFIRLMNAEKEVFDLVYSGDDAIFSLSQKPNDMNNLYFSEGHGRLSVRDERMGKLSSQWDLHEHRISTIDFNSQNSNIMATSSSDGTACLWDIRNVNSANPKCLMTVTHKRAVSSAYFSPSGSYLATTSYDNTVGIVSTGNSEDTCRIYHNNQTGRWLSSFRAIWGWDDTVMFIGNMNRSVDVLSRTQRKSIWTIPSPYMTAIPCRFDAHPCNVGMLAGATSGGQVYLFTSS